MLKDSSCVALRCSCSQAAYSSLDLAFPSTPISLSPRTFSGIVPECGVATERSEGGQQSRSIQHNEHEGGRRAALPHAQPAQPPPDRGQGIACGLQDEEVTEPSVHDEEV